MRPAPRRWRRVRAPAEDHRQEEALARLEAEAAGEDPDRAAFLASESLDRTERTLRFRLHQGSTLEAKIEGNHLDWLPDAARVVGVDRPARQTPGQRKKSLRNIAITVCWIAGFSQAQLAEVFDLPKSRISVIVEEVRQRVLRRFHYDFRSDPIIKANSQCPSNPSR